MKWKIYVHVFHFKSLCFELLVLSFVTNNQLQNFEIKRYNI
jgi:hypothetical protein